MLGLAPKIIAVTYGEGRRGLALGLFSTAFATGISVGAPLGGIITTYLGWPYIFSSIFPICAWPWWGAPSGSEVIKARNGAGGSSLLRSLGLSGPGLGPRSLLGLTGSGKPAGRRPRPQGSLGLGGAWAWLLIFLERRQSCPLINGELWRSWPFVAGSAAVVLTFAPVMGAFFLLPFFLEQVYRYSPDQTGLLLTALSLTNAAVAGVGATWRTVG